ncbi:MAG: SurA N-terminal domain-containing protein, partial [Deltaproteobacteria bacterium]|nr:SurA N-terminal domain-containing protein [Deltaproteobacteria bacterium]
MSRSVKQYIWGAAILAIALVFIMQFRPGAQLQGMGAEGGAEPTCAAEVDGKCIVTQSDYLTAFRLIASGNVDDDSRREIVRQLVLEGLVQRWLLQEDAARLGIGVSEEDVSRSLSRGLVRVSLPADHENDMLAYQLGLSQPDGAARAVPFKDPKTEKFDYERYKKWVQRVSGKTLKDFREFAAHEELAARMRVLVKSRARVSDEEAHAEFAVTSAKLVVDHVQLNRDWYQRQANASADAVAKWSTDHAKELDEAWAEKKDEFSPACRRTRHLFVRVDDSGDKAAATKKAREAIDAAKARIDGGEAFADVAREVSEDPQSASAGGALGCFAAG